jgi:hypothetical protein
MTLDSSGNVGIGLSTNIASKLHVNSELSLGPDNNNRMIVGSTSGGVGSIGTIENGTASFSTMTFKGGNVGIGLTPSSWFANSVVLQLNTGVSLEGRTNDGSSMSLGGNYYLDGSAVYKYLTTNSAQRYTQAAGTHIWYNAGSGTAGNSISWSERMRIDSSGRVMIGTTTEGQNQADNLTIADAGNMGMTLRSTNSGETSIFFSDGTSGAAEYAGWLQYVHSSNSMTFGTSSTERMRIDSSGATSIGTTTSSGQLTVKATADRAAGSFIVNANGDVAISIKNSSSTTVGTIVASASATAYNTSSDYRLKTDAQPMTGASDRVQALNPVNFEWISDGTRVDGFLAHEAQAVVPEAVTGTKDAMRDEEYEVTPAVLDDDGNVVTEAVMGTRSVPDYQGIDQSKLVPLLTAALQEALTKIDAMETRLAALEAE